MVARQRGPEAHEPSHVRVGERCDGPHGCTHSRLERSSALSKANSANACV